MKKQLSDTIMKIQMMSLILARQNDAANAVMKLQRYGITENQILEMARIIETNGYNTNGARNQWMFIDFLNFDFG